MRNLSIHIDAPLEKRGRKLGSLVADFFICLIISLLLFFASDAIHTSAGAYNEVGSSLHASENEMKDKIVAAKLGSKDNSGNLISLSQGASIYVLRLTYASLLHAGIEEKDISTQTYRGYTPLTPEEDPCYFYFTDFRKAHQADFDASTSYDYIKAIKDGREGYYTSDAYPYLTEEIARKIDEAYRRANYTEGATIRANLEALYKTTLTEAIKDFETHYTPYKNALAEYESHYRRLLLIKITEAFEGYGISCLILYLVLPLLFRHGRTLGCLALKSAYREKSGKEIAWYQITLHFLLILIEFVGIAPVSLLLVYGSEAMTLLSLPLFGAVPLFTVLICSFILMLASYLVSFFTKGRRQTLSELIGSMVQVQTRSLNG